MAADTTPITFAFTLPNGDPVAGGKVMFTLSGLDLDGGIVMPTTVEAIIAADGTGSVNLWPNDTGLKATSYKVTVSPSSGNRVEAGSIVVPASVAPVALHTLVPVAMLGALKAVVLTQAAYDALEEKSAQTIYLIRAEE